MDPLLISAVYGAVVWGIGKVVDATLSDNAPKLVSTLVGGVLGNTADRWVGRAWDKGLDWLRTTDPDLNHDLERATREAYLVATRELARQAIARVQVATSASQLRTAGDEETLQRMLDGIDTDLSNVANTLPTSLPDTHLLVTSGMPQQQRLQRLRDALSGNLSVDFARWAPARTFPLALEELLRDGWTIDTKYQKQVPRDWYSLISIAFVEKLKTSERLRAVFQTRILATIVEQVPQATTLSTFDGFTEALERFTAPLQRIEDQLGIIHRDLAETKSIVQEIRQRMQSLAVPRWILVTLLSLTSVTAAIVVLPPLTQSVCAPNSLRPICQSLGLPNIPSKAEEQLWEARRSGDCTSLRDYISRFPSGAYVGSALTKLQAARKDSVEQWVPDQIKVDLVVLSELTAFPNLHAAQADALRRGELQAAQACSGYATGEFRLESSKAQVIQWRCLNNRCGFEGEATCSVRKRVLTIKEVCP